MPITTKTRACAIVINTPEDDSAKSFYYNRESWLINGDTKIGRPIQQPAAISVSFAAEATTMRTAIDPITGQEVTVSIAGIAALIAADYNARQSALDAVPE